MAGLTKHDVSSRKWNNRTYISSSVFFLCNGQPSCLSPTNDCGTLNSQRVPQQQLWNSQFSESSTAVEVAQFLKGVCCLFLQLGPISFCMDQRSQEFDVSHLNVQMRWVLHVGHYPSLLYRHLCISMCSEKSIFEAGRWVGGIN